ncbi:hypothetical protein RHSIM_Rhsim13G0218300 [Rhododendron simsii]|uniref:Uncharacterized protein n=1 Tax=Rhododendron simsii TaxID=118357 RepID=A0A834FYI4_RHOSS|nr:hypothetical protein RHSIM_Rhsim13G0218300 [Rhododendron simsii]
MMPTHKFPTLNCLQTSLCIILAIYALVFFTQPYYPGASSFLISPLQRILSSPSQATTPPPPFDHNSPTNISHLVFGLVGSLNAWRNRKAYIESWWRPNVTRGYLYLDAAPTDELLPWSAASPPLRVSDDVSKIIQESGHVAPIMVRMVHAILEVYREGDQGVRWYVMGDDDSIFFVENWVDVLAKYDHTRYIYIGGQSETVMSNFYYSFDQGFGGAGFALSYPLASAMVKDLEGCIKRYPHLNSADFITKFCVDELGVSLSAERGIHQIDLRGDISGFLSSHPQSPLMSLHHFDMVDPIFPSMDRFQSANHLMKSARVDQSRLLQQTICYHRPTNWSFSVSWGYSAHIYEKILPRSILKRPLETFEAWARGTSPPFMFNTRRPPFNDLCDAPHVFFLETVENARGNHIVSTYARSSPRGLPTCSSSGNHSAEHISKVRVLSPPTKLIRTSLCITLAIYAVAFITQPYYPASEFFFSPLQSILSPSQTSPPPIDRNSPTNINHLVFGLVGSLKAWRHRKAYIESWWRPNVTRGYLYLDTAPTDEFLPWSAASPPLRVSDDISKIVEESGHVAPIMVRMVHAILEGFGGAGFALSYPLASAMVKDLEGCLKRYPHLNSADLITQYCVDELGVSLSAERGIHQIDLRGDISGFLSSHPQSPLMSLHHLDMVDPIFPSMDRFQSVNHLMKSAKVDQSRLLQQTICYHKPTNWSFSVSWGYSAHIYEKVFVLIMLTIIPHL